MTQQYVAAEIAAPEMFTTIYSGMDVEPFLDPPRSREDVRAELGFEDEDVVVGKVARLFDLKGHRYLLEAASRIIEACPRARFLLVGDGPLRDRFEAQISRDGLSDHFVLTGLVPPERIPELIHTTDELAREDDQGRIDWERTIDEVDGFYHPDEGCYLFPGQNDDPVFEKIKRGVRALRRDEG